MKNRVILNGQGIPVVPLSDKIQAQVAASDAKKEFKEAMLSAYKQGFYASCDCMENSFKKAIEDGHEGMKLTDGIKLVEELRVIADKMINDWKT